MKITAVTPYVVRPELGALELRDDWQWTFIVIETDSGLTGWGESSSSPRKGSFLTARGIQVVQDALIGEDPANIENIWHRLYRRYTYMGSRGFPTTLLSGIDIALWDLKGKVLNQPVYELLGGKVRDEIRLYANGWFDNCHTADEYARAAQLVVDLGHDAIKLDPFLEMMPRHTMYLDGQISKRGEQDGYDRVSAIRQCVGSDVEILIDAHGNFNVPTAVRLADRLTLESDIGWFEEPVPPESLDALENIRRQTKAPLCTGERLFTRWDFLPVLTRQLADYLMPDVTWTGGISELKKIANLAEIFNIPISPHNAQGPGQILAGAHVAMHVPNFYRLEHCVSFIPGYNEFLQTPLEFNGNRLAIPNTPGLGIELDIEQVHAKLHPDWPVE